MNGPRLCQGKVWVYCQDKDVNVLARFLCGFVAVLLMLTIYSSAGYFWIFTVFFVFMTRN